MNSDMLPQKSKFFADVTNIPIDSESAPISPKRGIEILQNIVLCGPEEPSTSGEGIVGNEAVCGGYEQGLCESNQQSIPVMSLEDDFDPSVFEPLMDMFDYNVEVHNIEEASSSQVANGRKTRATKSSRSKQRGNKNVDTNTSKLKSLLTKESSGPTKRRKMPLRNSRGNKCKKTSVGNRMAFEERPVVNLVSESDSDSDMTIFSQAEDREMIKAYNRKRNGLEIELQHRLKEIKSNEAIVKTACADLQVINNRLHSFVEVRKRVTEGRQRIIQERRRLDEEERRLDEEERGYNIDCLSLEQDGRQLQTHIDESNKIIHANRIITHKLLQKIDYLRKKC